MSPPSENGEPERPSSADSTRSPNSAPSSPKGLTEEQKKANHIASEKKRRNNIREQYDKLAAMTPGMGGQARAEGKVLEAAVKFCHAQKKERERLIHEIESKGGVVDKKWKSY